MSKLLKVVGFEGKLKVVEDDDDGYFEWLVLGDDTLVDLLDEKLRGDNEIYNALFGSNIAVRVTIEFYEEEE